MEASVIRLAAGTLGARALLLGPSQGTWETLLWGRRETPPHWLPSPGVWAPPQGWSRMWVLLQLQKRGQKCKVGTLGAMKCPLDEAAGVVGGERVGLGGEWTCGAPQGASSTSIAACPSLQVLSPFQSPWGLGRIPLYQWSAVNKLSWASAVLGLSECPPLLSWALC